MKFNYFKVAKEKGIYYFDFAFNKKHLHGDQKYMAAHWLACAYHFQSLGHKQYVRLYLYRFLIEIKSICDR